MIKYLAYIFLKLFLRKNKRSSYAIIVNSAIGDTCYALSFSQHLIANYDCLFFLSSNRKDLIEYSYPFLPKGCVKYIREDSLTRKVLRRIMIKREVWPFLKKYNYYFAYPSSCYDLTNLVPKSFIDILREDIFTIGINAPISYPNIPVLPIKTISNFEQVKNRMVILNPFSNSSDYGEISFWHEIVFILKEKGYIVYTNIVKGQEVIKGTEPLSCSIYEFLCISNSIPLIISVRTGLIDYAIATSSKKYIVYFEQTKSGVPTETFKNVYNLLAWKVNNIWELDYTSLAEAIDDFKLFMQKDS